MNIATKGGLLSPQSNRTGSYGHKQQIPVRLNTIRPDHLVRRPHRDLTILVVSRLGFNSF